jgi:YHS domain-containing protein
MGMSKFIKASMSISVLSFLITTGVFAQDKKEDSCCKSTDKMEKMDKSCMISHDIQDSTQSIQLKVNKVDSKSEAWNAVCPVHGEEIDPEANKVEYNGKVYGFCCNGCDSKFTKDPEKYSKNLSEDGKTFVGTK